MVRILSGLNAYAHTYALPVGCQSSIRSGIERQLKEYPESRVQDIYKCFCQDNLGPEHLIPNPQTAADYLASELTEYSHDLASRKYSKPTLRYFATGDEGHFIIHHSDKFGQVYNPHYRIIAKDIFKSEILPLIK